MADEKESALLEWLEKEEDENEDETDFKEESLRRSWVVVNIFGKAVNVEPLQILYN